MGWQGPRLGFVAETGSFVNYRRLEYGFLAVCLASFSPPLSPKVSVLLVFRPCSSHLLLLSNYVFLCH